jgi:hypothetical protein
MISHPHGSDTVIEPKAAATEMQRERGVHLRDSLDQICYTLISATCESRIVHLQFLQAGACQLGSISAGKQRPAVTSGPLWVRSPLIRLQKTCVPEHLSAFPLVNRKYREIQQARPSRVIPSSLRSKATVHLLRASSHPAVGAGRRYRTS